MKRIIIAIIVLLLAIAYGYAEVSQAEEAVKLEKKRQLDVKAAQFKAETGFKGTISYDLDAGVFEQLRGTFPNCEVRDTLAAQSQALLLINNLLPYIRIDVNQLSLRSVSSSDIGIRVLFDQKIDGLEMEPSSGILVFFRTKYFIEVNVTSSLIPDLHFDKTKYLSKEEAQIIFDKEIGSAYKQRFKDDLIVSREYSTDLPCLRKPEFYRVCWRMPYSIGPSGEAHILYIDAVTGEVLGNIMPVPFDDISYHVSGDVYPMDNFQPSNVVSNPLENVELNLNGLTKYTDENGDALYSEFSSVNNFSNSLGSQQISVLDGNNLSENITAPATTLITNQEYTVLFDDQHGNAPTVFYYLNEMRNYFQNIGFHALYTIPIQAQTNIVLQPNLQGPVMGQCDPTLNPVTIKFNSNSYGSRCSYIAKHEFTHAYMYDYLGGGLGNISDHRGMDEALAYYFPMMCDNSNIVYTPNTDGTTKVDNVTQMLNSIYEVRRANGIQNSQYSEDDYALYRAGSVIAAAWYELRQSISDYQIWNQLLDLRPIIGEKRYQPRSFYNILMHYAASDTTFKTRNTVQVAINNAYNKRALFFEPSVKSTDLIGLSQITYKVGQKVYLRVENCPPNASFSAYIYKDRDIDYVDGMSIPSNHIVGPINGTTSPYGATESILLWTIPTNAEQPGVSGDYDIVVDFGEGGVCDNIISFAFQGIQDGFAGLDGYGFKVEEDDDYYDDIDELSLDENIFDSDFVYKDIDLTESAGTFTDGWICDFISMASFVIAHY